MTKLSPFDIVNTIYLKDRELTDEEIALYYNPYIINRALSFNLDTLAFANELNQNWQLSKQMQYHFLYYGVEKRKRYGKWYKKEVDTEEKKVNLIKRYFDYSTAKAREVLPLIEQQNVWKQMEDEMETGGVRR